MKFRRFSLLSAAILFGQFVMTVPCLSQSGGKAAIYPSHLPYSFSNFVWWSNEELRALLKKRVPGLGDEIPTTHAAEGRVRDALTALLKEKGIVAEVQSEEPSNSSFGPPVTEMLGMGDLEAPPFTPTIIFSLLRPRVVLGKITVQSTADEIRNEIEGEFKGKEGKEFTSGSVNFSKWRVEEIVKRHGYLGEQVLIRRMPVYKEGDQYLVDLAVVVDAGRKYHVSVVSVDGGPLFEGKDLMQLVRVRTGDVAGDSPFGKIGPELKAYYQQFGFADVRINAKSTLDNETATVAYALTVVSGPVYHLRSLTVERLSPDQESRVRELLGMKPGDVYREDAINGLYRKIADEPLLKGYEFGYSPKADKAAAVVDLTLDFNRKGGTATVRTE